MYIRVHGLLSNPYMEAPQGLAFSPYTVTPSCRGLQSGSYAQREDVVAEAGLVRHPTSLLLMEESLDHLKFPIPLEI